MEQRAHGSALPRRVPLLGLGAAEAAGNTSHANEEALFIFFIFSVYSPLCLLVFFFPRDGSERKSEKTKIALAEECTAENIKQEALGLAKGKYKSRRMEVIDEEVVTGSTAVLYNKHQHSSPFLSF